MAEASREDGRDWLGLAGRVCVVTGAGNGIGAETARQLAALGAKVAVLDRDRDADAAVAHEIESSGGIAISVVTDGADAEAVIAAAARVREELGPCQVLVNNAAARLAGSLLKIDQDAWSQVMAVNLTGAWTCAQSFVAQMIDGGRGGSIIHVASITAHHPLPHGGAYSISKAGVMMLSRLLALELAEHGIRSNTVSPGLIRTPATESTYRDTELANARKKMIPAGRVGDPADIANVVAFLASDRSSYINGQDLVADGGIGQALMCLMPRPAVQA